MTKKKHWNMVSDTTLVSYLPFLKMILHFLPLFIFPAGFILEGISSKKYVQLFLFSYTNQKQFYNQPLTPFEFLRTNIVIFLRFLGHIYIFFLSLSSQHITQCFVQNSVLSKYLCPVKFYFTLMNIF